jgi:glycosyltransferase involved in cell wall biosynthesis
MRKKVINILFNDFTNDNRVLKESVSLIKGGFDVELVATRFDKKNPQREEVQKIQVNRVSVGKVKILPLNLLLFWINVVRLYKREFIFHCNDLYALPPAYIIKNFFNKDAKIVYDCHEHETEAAVYLGKPLLKWIAKIFEKKMIRRVDRVISVSESIAQDYMKLYQIEKPFLVMNCPYFNSYRGFNLFREELNLGQEKILFLYQGEYLQGRGVEKLIEIFKKLEKLNKDLTLILLVYGEGVEELKDKIKNSGNIFWHDKVSKDIYMNYVASADWGIYLMENICKNHDYALPNKLFDYIMANLPVVVSDLREMKKFVEDNRVGYAIDSKDTEEVIELLRSITKEKKIDFDKQLKIAMKEYCWEGQEKVLLKIYNSL